MFISLFIVETNAESFVSTNLGIAKEVIIAIKIIEIIISSSEKPLILKP